MSSVSVHGQDSSNLESEQLQIPSSVDPQSQQQLLSRLPDNLARPNCTNYESAVAVKPLHLSESEIGNASMNPQTKYPAPQSSRLLALPVELRRQILHFVLPYSSADTHYGCIWHLGDTSLLRTCYQLHEEGTSLLYSSNTFVVDVRKEGHYAVDHLAPPGVDFALILDFLLRIHYDVDNRAVGVRNFSAPLPMRPEDVRLIQRLEINIPGMNYYRRRTRDDTLKLALRLGNRVQNMLDCIQQGRQGLKMVRVRWQGEIDDADLEGHRRTILKPFHDKGIAVEEDFDLWFIETRRSKRTWADGQRMQDLNCCIETPAGTTES